MTEAASQESASLGQIIADRYKILKKLGEGGMGEVYMAEHIHIEKRFALKLLRAEVLSNQEAVARFRQEARSASSIGHENIIQIDDFGTLADGRVYMAMEYLAGAPLNDILKEGELPLGRALDILIQTGKGLAAAHAKGITHRDMKPENVFVTPRDGRDLVKILDFGIAKVSGGSGEASNLTQAGTIFGTPFYMAPEQALSSKMDHRVDVYAMGVMLYETFTGRLPFTGETFMGILTQHITTVATPPTAMAAQNGRSVPAELEAVIVRAMQKAPEDRYQSMNELVAAMTEVYRMFVGARDTGLMAASPVGTSQFVPVPSTYLNAYTPGQTAAGMAAVSHPSVPMGRKKSGALGLFALFAILGVAGGAVAAWYFVAGPGRKPPVVAEVTPRPPVAEVKSAVVPMKPVDVLPPVDTKPPPVETKPPPVDTKPVESTPGRPIRPKPDVKPTPVKTVEVLVDSYPRGASIYQGGEKVGETPSNVTVTVGKSAQLSLRMSGYQDAAVSVDGSEKKVKKSLKKIRTAEDPGEIKGWGEVTGGDDEKDEKDEKEKKEPAKVEDPDGLE